MTALVRPATAGRRSAPADMAQTLGAALDQLFTLRHTASTEVVFVRHGEPDALRTEQCERLEDIPLSADGREQAMLLAVRMQAQRVDAIYSSPAAYALETAAYLAAPHGLPIARCSNLRDISVRLEDPPPPAYSRAPERDIVRQLVAEPKWDSLPGMEPSRAFRRRAIEAVEAIIARHHADRVVVVTHSSVINAYLSMILGIARDVFFIPAHASLSVVRSAGDLYAVAHLNDIAHLSEPLQSY